MSTSSNTGCEIPSNLKEYAVEGDGSCFFRSVAQAMSVKHLNKMLSKDLETKVARYYRHRVVDFMKDSDIIEKIMGNPNLTKYLEKKTLSNLGIQENNISNVAANKYVNGMKLNRTYVGPLEVLFTQFILNTKICLNAMNGNRHMYTRIKYMEFPDQFLNNTRTKTHYMNKLSNIEKDLNTNKERKHMGVIYLNYKGNIHYNPYVPENLVGSKNGKNVNKITKLTNEEMKKLKIDPRSFNKNQGNQSSTAEYNEAYKMAIQLTQQQENKRNNGKTTGKKRNRQETPSASQLVTTGTAVFRNKLTSQGLNNKTYVIPNNLKTSLKRLENPLIDHWLERKDKIVLLDLIQNYLFYLDIQRIIKVLKLRNKNTMTVGMLVKEVEGFQNKNFGNETGTYYKVNGGVYLALIKSLKKGYRTINGTKISLKKNALSNNSKIGELETRMKMTTDAISMLILSYLEKTLTSLACEQTKQKHVCNSKSKGRFARCMNKFKKICAAAVPRVPTAKRARTSNTSSSNNASRRKAFPNTLKFMKRIADELFDRGIIFYNKVAYAIVLHIIVFRVILPIADTGTRQAVGILQNAGGVVRGGVGVIGKGVDVVGDTVAVAGYVPKSAHWIANTVQGTGMVLANIGRGIGGIFVSRQTQQYLLTNGRRNTGGMNTHLLNYFENHDTNPYKNYFN